MPSELYTADGVVGTPDGPLPATARRHLRPLLAVFFLVSAVVAAAAQSVDFASIVPAAVRPVRPASLPLSDLRLAVEVGTLVGAVAAVVLLVALLGRDPRVSLSRGRRHASLAAAAFAGGGAAGLTALPDVVGLIGPFAAASGSALDAYWFAEVWLFLPVALGFAAAAPFLLVAAVRAGVVGRFTTTGQRGYVALASVVFAACFSPPDGVTFVAFVAPLFVGFAAGVGWLELR